MKLPSSAEETGGWPTTNTPCLIKSGGGGTEGRGVGGGETAQKRHHSNYKVTTSRQSALL